MSADWWLTILCSFLSTAEYAKYAKAGRQSLSISFPCAAYFAIAAVLVCYHPMKTDLIFKEESYKIIGACFEVYREKGCGFLEAVYQDCMEIELRLQGVLYVAKHPLVLEYKQCPLRTKYEPDFIC